MPFNRISETACGEVLSPIDLPRASLAAIAAFPIRFSENPMMGYLVTAHHWVQPKQGSHIRPTILTYSTTEWNTLHESRSFL